MKKQTVLTATGLIAAIFLIPYALVSLIGHPLVLAAQAKKAPLPTRAPGQDALTALQTGPSIKVYMTETGAVQTMPLELYVARVVAGEMPVGFAASALEAQAICARTNAVRAIYNRLPSTLPEAAAAGAQITDDYHYDQAYSSQTALQREWAGNYAQNWQKIAQAVATTKSQILTYQGQPIDAFFFSTSDGYTQSATDYWGKSIPYLQAVASPWDASAPHYKSTQVISVNTLWDKLHINAVPTMSGNAGIGVRILDESTSHHVTKVQAGDNVMSGKDFRLALGLASTDFTMQREGDNVVFQLVGYGHGVGMSQYGAEGLAKSGKTADQIVTYYYHDVNIASVASFVQN